MIQFRNEHPIILREISVNFAKCKICETKKKLTQHIMRHDALEFAADHIGLINACIQEFVIHPELQPAIECIALYASQFCNAKDNGYHWHPTLTHRPTKGNLSFLGELRRYRMRVVGLLPPLTEREDRAFTILQEEAPIMGEKLAEKANMAFETIRQLCSRSGKFTARGAVNAHNGKGYYVKPM